MDAPWVIRPARVADARAVAAVERRCFGDPWSAEAFAETFASPLALSLVAVSSAGIEGYVIARHIAGEAEILNLATVPEMRRRGIGAQLLDAELERLRTAGAREVYLEVRAGNAAAQALYAGRGFQPIGRRQGYYRSPVEDAIVLQLTWPASA